MGCFRGVIFCAAFIVERFYPSLAGGNRVFFGPILLDDADVRGVHLCQSGTNKIIGESPSLTIGGIQMKRLHLAFFYFLTLLAASGCGPKNNDVKVALALPLTGDIGSLGQGIQRAILLAFDEAKTENRLPFPVKIISFDDRSDPKEAVSVANRIVADRRVVAVVGHFNSGCSIPASSVYAQAGLPMITPASSNPVLTDQQLSPQWIWPRCIFRVNTTDTVQGPWGADYLVTSLKLEKLAVIHDKTAYGQGVAEEFKKRAEKIGGKIVAFEGIQLGDRDFRSVLTKIKSASPQAIYFGGVFSEGGILVRQARDIGYKGVFMASEANYDPVFITVAGPAAEGAYVTFLGATPDLLPAAKKFRDAYRAKYPGEEIKSYDGYGYEVANLVIEALAAVGPDREKIIAYLRDVRFNGIMGETKFDEKGDTLNKTITLFQVQKGIFVPVNAPKGE